MIARRLASEVLQRLSEQAAVAGRPEKGFYTACEDLQPDKRFVVNAGSMEYPLDNMTTAIGLPAFAGLLDSLSA